MPSKLDQEIEALKSFTAATDEFLCAIVKDAMARGFCKACALNFVARIVVAACEVVPHENNALTDELRPTNFDDAPGHA